MKLARINTLLVIAIVLINSYIIVFPVVPALLFWYQGHDSSRTKQLEAKVRTLGSSKPATDVPKTNQLTIPSMVLDEAVYEGKTMATLRKGLWHRPSSSTPDKGGNTVIVGHRLTYSNPRATLYNLDKVKINDTIGLWWNGKPYTYTVSEVKVVKADEVSIEAPTSYAQLTIYTCTPLWLPKDRLVVIAKPAGTL